MTGGAAPLPVRVRDAAPGDLGAILEIYAHHVRHGTGSFETEPPDAGEMARRFGAVRAAGLPWLVAEAAGDGATLLGYAYAAPYRPRPAYRHTVEDSVYVAPGAAGRGVGRALLGAVVARAEAAGFRQMLAVVGDGAANRASVRLHARLGFAPVGTLRAVGFKHGRWLDAVLMQRPLGPGDASPPAPPVRTPRGRWSGPWRSAPPP